MKKIIPIIIVIAILVGVGSFYGGMKYSEYKNPQNNFSNFGNLSPEQMQQRMQEAGGTGNAGNRQPGGGFVNGEIISKDDQNITIKTPNNGSKIIFYSDSTTVEKSASGSLSDLNIGDTISISGKTNQDGSLNADSIQIKNQLPEQLPASQ